MTAIRKQLPNYLLPSEGWDHLRALVGKSIRSIRTGTWHNSLDELRQTLGVDDNTNLMAVCHGGPILMAFDEDRTFVFQSDEFAQSIVFRVLPVGMDSSDFLDEFYREDAYFPEYLRMKSIIDLGDSCGRFIGKRIHSVRVLKLPDNFFGAPTKGVHVHEMVAVLTLEDAGELLIAFRMGMERRPDHCLLTWELVAKDFPTESLECVCEHHDW